MRTLSVVGLLAAVALPPSLRADTGTLASLARRYVAAHSGGGIPSFSRQTGLACSACHYAFPQLTPFGRLFKLNGYTMTALQTVGTGDTTREALRLNLIPPLSVMVQASYTSLNSDVPGTANGVSQFPQQLSLFVGEAITPSIGTFLQVTYEPSSGTIGMDNADIRFAGHGSIASKSLIYGATLNNNPTVQDVWNTVPAWGYPYASSAVAPSPAAATLIDGALGQQVAGLGAYALWNNLLYGEVSAYRAAPQGGANPPDSTSENTVHGTAPYWRLALQHQWGSRSLEVGTYGMVAHIFPQGLSQPTNKYTDVAFDAQYEQTVGSGGSLTGHATWIHESQNLDASVAGGAAANVNNTLQTVRVDATFYSRSARYGATVGVFTTSGDADSLAYAPAAVTGSATGQPNSRGAIAELQYMPWLNTRFSVQYIMYSRFNGGSSNYDGSGRNASDNNTLYALVWLMF